MPENANDMHICNKLMVVIGFVCQKIAMPVWVNVSSKHKHLPRRESILGVCDVLVYLRACLWVCVFGPVRVSGVCVCVRDQRRRVCLKCVFTRLCVCVCIYVCVYCAAVHEYKL